MNTTYRSLLLVLTFTLVAGVLLAAPAAAKSRRGELGNTGRTPAGLALPSDPCSIVGPVLNGYLPKTVTLKKTSSYWAKLTVNKGV